MFGLNYLDLLEPLLQLCHTLLKIKKVWKDESSITFLNFTLRYVSDERSIQQLRQWTYSFPESTLTISRSRALEFITSPSCLLLSHQTVNR